MIDRAYIGPSVGPYRHWGRGMGDYEKEERPQECRTEKPYCVISWRETLPAHGSDGRIFWAGNFAICSAAFIPLIIVTFEKEFFSSSEVNLSKKGERRRW